MIVIGLIPRRAAALDYTRLGSRLSKRSTYVVPPLTSISTLRSCLFLFSGAYIRAVIRRKTVHEMDSRDCAKKYFQEGCYSQALEIYTENVVSCLIR